MTKPQKSELIKELEMKLINDDERVPSKDSKLQTPCITDVMTNIRKIKTKDIDFRKIFEQFLEYVSGVVRGPERLYLDFDSYVQGSMKYSERNRRQDKAPIDMNYINSDTPLLVEMDRFWSSRSNKMQLQILLHTHAIKHGMEKPSTVYVVASCFTGASYCATCKGVMDERPVEVKEADAGTIPYAMHAVRSGS
jgi:hypothetical protein